MTTEAVAPFHLHRDLEEAKAAPADLRLVLLITILESGNLAVIRRIPELSPLSTEERGMIADWAERVTRHKSILTKEDDALLDEYYNHPIKCMFSSDLEKGLKETRQQHRKDDDDVSNRDFAFHLMVACGVPAGRILHILERHNTFSRSALEHIQQVLQGSDVVGRLDSYLREVAETLLKDERVPSRDRGRHMLMTLAKTEDEWLALAERLSAAEISDLRQKVLERFLWECTEEAVALPLFTENVVKMCLEKIRKNEELSGMFGVHLVASHMHWVISCLERTGDQKGLVNAATMFRYKFDKHLPHSVSGRIGKYLRGLQQQPKPQVIPVRDPHSVDQAIKDGWTVRVDRGKQVVLVKDGKSITRYRS